MGKSYFVVRFARGEGLADARFFRVGVAVIAAGTRCLKPRKLVAQQNVPRMELDEGRDGLLCQPHVIICHRLSCRIVTIGPIVFLGLLGVTFHIGARSTRRASLNQCKINARRGFRKPTELSVPVWTKKIAYPAIMPETTSTSPQSMPRATVGTSRAHARELSEKGLAGTDNSTNSVEVARDVHEEWAFDVGSKGEVEVEAEEVCSISPPPTERTIGASTRSLRSIRKAGPGNKTNPEQVKDSDYGGGGSRLIWLSLRGLQQTCCTVYTPSGFSTSKHHPAKSEREKCLTWILLILRRSIFSFPVKPPLLVIIFLRVLAPPLTRMQLRFYFFVANIRLATRLCPLTEPALGTVCPTHHHVPHHPVPRLQSSFHGGECSTKHSIIAGIARKCRVVFHHIVCRCLRDAHHSPDVVVNEALHRQPHYIARVLPRTRRIPSRSGPTLSPVSGHRHFFPQCRVLWQSLSYPIDL